MYLFQRCSLEWLGYTYYWKEESHDFFPFHDWSSCPCVHEYTDCTLSTHFHANTILTTAKKHSSKRLKIPTTCDCCLISWTWDCAYSLACMYTVYIWVKNKTIFQTLATILQKAGVQSFLCFIGFIGALVLNVSGIMCLLSQTQNPSPWR